MSRAAFPAYCEGGEFPSSEAASLHYETQGFKLWDTDGSWRLLRRGVFEAYIRPANKARIGWIASVVQLAPNTGE